MNSSFAEYDGGEGSSTLTATALDRANNPAQPSIPVKLAASLAQYLLDKAGWDGNPASPKLKDWKSLVNIRRAIQEVRPESPQAAAELAKVREIIGAAVHEMENPPMLREHVRATPDIERHGARPKSRAGLIAALEAALSSDAFNGPLILQDKVVNPLIARVYLDDELGKGARHWAFQLRKQVAEYILDFNKSEVRLYPDVRKDEIVLEMAGPGLTLERLRALQSELIDIESTGAKIIADSENARLIAAFEPIKENLKYLAYEILYGLRTLRESAVESEKSFFNAHGVPYEKTGATRKYDGLIAMIEDDQARKNSGEQQHGRYVAPSPGWLTLWGIEIPGVS